MHIRSPYLLFIGDAQDPLSIKMARSAADWCPEKCVGEFALPGCSVSTGLPLLSIAQAAGQGAKSFVLGFANSGGTFDPAWTMPVLEAMEAGMDIISGLHDKLADIPQIAKAASALGRQLVELRHPTEKFATGTGRKRSGKRLLTVGTDCSVGKMYSTLSLYQGMQKQGRAATFRATGQCGILVSGAGLAVDCVISDFISGAVEQLSPDNDSGHWDLIEGQGSLSHPAFAGVSLGLLHGAQPDALVLCHALGRTHMRGLPDYAQPTLEQSIALNEQAARLTNPDAKFIGVCVNTSALDDAAAQQACDDIHRRLDLPCVDPVRHGVEALLSRLG